ncbi:MAG: DUF4383 domain-containing protein [Chloroflexi bacterium]|nr:DUF4383 domain-containing protein [Chloroflexota bacterium]
MKNRALTACGLGAGRALSPARVFLWMSVAYLLVLGLGSLLVNSSFAVGDEVSGDHLFGAIETNGWHGLSGLLLGAASLAFAMSARWAREGAAIIGASLLASGVLLLLYGEGSVALGLIPVDARDAVLLHVLPGVVGLVCAGATPRWRSRNATAGPVSRGD